jgi:hypothetical protein
MKGKNAPAEIMFKVRKKLDLRIKLIKNIEYKNKSRRNRYNGIDN